MSPQPPVRLARRRDARPIAELSRDFIEHGLHWRYDRAAVLKAIADPTVNVAVAGEGKAVLGFGIMEYREAVAHLVLLGVWPQHQSRGLGRRLVEWLEQPAVVAGIGRVRVEVRGDNPGGTAFYRRLGYCQRARVAGYYDGIVDALRLEKELGVTTPSR